MWYNVTILNLGLGGEEFHMYINGEDTQVTSDAFDGLDLSALDGILYVGGHPSPRHIRV